MITEKESILIQPFVNPCRAVVEVPGSKSISNRALILSVMCKGQVELNGLLKSEDVDLMQQALLHLGVNIQKNGNNIKVFGNGGVINKKECTINVGNAGTIARFLTCLLPELTGRFQAQAMRVPTANVSAIDLSIMLNSQVDVDAINRALSNASEGYLTDVLGYTEEPLASCDFNHDPRSGIVDASQTRVSQNKLVKVLIWFDNECGYANRMLDTLRHWSTLFETAG